MKFSEKVAKIVQECREFAREHGWAEYVYAPYVPLQVPERTTFKPQDFLTETADEWRKKMETMKIEDRSELRILADAICNVMREGDTQSHNCYLGIEGDNGVACEKCQRIAVKVAMEQERIRAGLRKMDASLGREPMPEYIDIVFDGPPGPEAPRFVEVENREGASIEVGEWVPRPGGHWALRIAGLND